MQLVKNIHILGGFSMNTKKSLSLILLGSLLSQSNAFGMFKMSKLFKNVGTSIFYNTTPSKAVLFSGFSTARRSKKQKFRVLKKRQRNAYTKLLIQNKLRNRINTNKEIVAKIKETNNKIGQELNGKFANNLCFNMATALVLPTTFFRVYANFLSTLYVWGNVENSINTHMNNLEKKLTTSPKKIRRKKKVIKIKKK